MCWEVEKAIPFQPHSCLSPGIMKSLGHVSMVFCACALTSCIRQHLSQLNTNFFPKTYLSYDPVAMYQNFLCWVLVRTLWNLNIHGTIFMAAWVFNFQFWFSLVYPIKDYVARKKLAQFRWVLKKITSCFNNCSMPLDDLTFKILGKLVIFKLFTVSQWFILQF